MAFGIADLERDVQKFKQDIENAKATYIEEYAEYLNIATDFENVEQKYDFLQEEVEFITKVFPEETKSNVSVATDTIFAVSGVFDIIAGISYIVNRYNSWKLIKVLRKTGQVDEALRFFTGTKKLINLAKMADVAETAKIARLAKTAKITRIAGTAGFILAIVGIALVITDVVKRKKYLQEQKDELQKHLDEFNSIIAEANDDTKNIIDAFLIYFNELGIDVEGVFNDNKDGFLDESGQQKFDDPENGVVSQLREALNGAIRAIGELNASIGLANRFIERNMSKGLAGAELIEEVIFATELPEELIQRLYVFKLRELGNTVQEAIELSGLSEDLVKELYARGYLDDGKTVEDTIELSGLTEDQVRRVFASKLLDDELNAENPDDVIDLKAIAEQAGLSEEVVREIRAGKLADLQSFSEEEEP
ncbi:hypothetical protein VB735_15640 [Halotia wernerae UHCC 0503]|nr:hypothetical protein [Halotia wernerae UHCC 0503]